MRIVVMLGLVIVVIVGGVGVAVAEHLEPRHEYTEHGTNLVDIAFDAQHGVVWSLDADGGFVGYDFAGQEVIATKSFEIGHAVAVGDGVVYVAAGNTLWEYGVEAGEWTEITTEMRSAAASMAHDPNRGVVWTTGGTGVYAYATENGSLVASHTEHSDGTSDLAVQGRYVASATTWDSEVLVYDVAEDAIVYEPQLPDDVNQVGAVHLTSDGRLIVGTAADEGSLVAVFDVDRQEQLVGYREHLFVVSDLAFDADAGTVISTGFDNRITLFDLDRGEVIERYQHDDTIYAADLDTENNLLWFGDGEEGPGSVIGLNLAPDTTATPTPASTAVETTTSSTEPRETTTATESEGTTPGSSTETRTSTPPDDTDPATTTPGQSGMGILAAAIGLVLGWGTLRYRDADEA